MNKKKILEDLEELKFQADYILDSVGLLSENLGDIINDLNKDLKENGS